MSEEKKTLDELALEFAITIQTKEGTISRLNAIEWFKAGYNKAVDQFKPKPVESDRSGDYLMWHKEQIEGGEVLPLDFVKWYSGMGEDKILKAHARWHNEIGNNPQPLTDKKYSVCEHHPEKYGKCLKCGEQLFNNNYDSNPDKKYSEGEVKEFIQIEKQGFEGFEIIPMENNFTSKDGQALLLLSSRDYNNYIKSLNKQ